MGDVELLAAEVNPDGEAPSVKVTESQKGVAGTDKLRFSMLGAKAAALSRTDAVKSDKVAAALLEMTSVSCPSRLLAKTAYFNDFESASSNHKTDTEAFCGRQSYRQPGHLIDVGKIVLELNKFVSTKFFSNEVKFRVQ